jgi:hypothetical protein
MKTGSARLPSLALCLALALAALGCTVPMRTPVLGFIYTNVQSGEEATNVPSPTKRGEACATSILGLVATGNASIDAAARQGGITSIAYVDASHSTILGLYSEYCTLVYGQ